MKNKYRIFIALVSCLLFIGWANNWEDIKKASKDIKSISAEFVQKKHMKILSRPLNSYGKFYFSAPDSLRWEYISPIKSILLTHRGKIKRYIEGHSGFIEDRSARLQAMQIVMQEITSWLNGRFHDNPNFTAALKTVPVPKIILTPKEKSIP